MLKNTGTFWDFRLESQFVDSTSLDSTKVFPVLDLFVPPSSDDIPSFPKIHPNMTGGEDGSIDSNSRQKPQEPSLSSSVDSPDRDFHLTTTPNVSDVVVFEIPTPPSSLAPVVPTIAESDPVLPPASGPSVVAPVASGPSVSPSVSPTPSVVVPVASGSSVSPPVSPTPSVVAPVASDPSVSPPVSPTPSVVVPVASGPSVSPPVSPTPSVVAPVASDPSVSPSVSPTPSVVAPVSSGSSVPPSVSPTPSVVVPVASGSSVSPSISEPSSHFKPNVRVVVPQVLTYLLVPNTLFYAGLMDISNQNKQLKTLRTVSGWLLKNDENPALFLRAYGGHHHYTSNLSALKYGDYGGELDYNALEANILLKKIESAYSTTSFGIMGNYGKLSLQPRKVKQSQESIFDKWTITAYGSMQHDTGLYMDGLFSYGLFNGNVLTLKRGKTAALRGKPLNVSLTAGKTFMIGSQYFIFEPQIQFVYQNLQFNKTRDIDNFNIDMRSPDHWGMRIGGYLTKTLIFTKDAHVLSFYGKLHFIRSFDDKQFVYFKDAFQLSSFGSFLEAGFGVYSQLSPKIIFHSDMIYQHKFTKSGFSGTHFSGGLSYHF